MTTSDPGSAWLVGDIGDPSLQQWLRRKVRTHLFITQDRIEADDLVQELNLHLLESLSLFPSSGKTWPHFCRSLVFRKIRHVHHPRPSKAELPVREVEASAAANETGKRPARAIPRPDPRFKLSRLLGSQTIHAVAKQTGIPAKTLRAPIAKMKLAMSRRYPELYGAPKQPIGYRGMIRWEPPSILPQPSPPEPTLDSGVVVWLQPKPPKEASSQTEAAQSPTTQETKRPKASAKKVKRSKGPNQQKAAAKRKGRGKRRPARKRTSCQAQHTRRERKRARRRLARPSRRRKKPTIKANRARTKPRTRLPYPRARGLFFAPAFGIQTRLHGMTRICLGNYSALKAPSYKPNTL